MKCRTAAVAALIFFVWINQVAQCSAVHPSVGQCISNKSITICPNVVYITNFYPAKMIVTCKNEFALGSLVDQNIVNLLKFDQFSNGAVPIKMVTHNFKYGLTGFSTEAAFINSTDVIGTNELLVVKLKNVTCSDVTHMYLCEHHTIQVIGGTVIQKDYNHQTSAAVVAKAPVTSVAHSQAKTAQDTVFLTCTATAGHAREDNVTGASGVLLHWEFRDVTSSEWKATPAQPCMVDQEEDETEATEKSAQTCTKVVKCTRSFSLEDVDGCSRSFLCYANRNHRQQSQILVINMTGREECKAKQAKSVVHHQKGAIIGLSVVITLIVLCVIGVAILSCQSRRAKSQYPVLAEPLFLAPPRASAHGGPAYFDISGSVRSPTSVQGQQFKTFSVPQESSIAADSTTELSSEMSSSSWATDGESVID